MNKQNSNGIEWTNYTWNPVAGCKHGCRWHMPDGSTAVCYAETVAERVAQAAYPHGFAHHYSHPKRLTEPERIKTPSRIFLDSISDLMGAWVSDDEITSVLDACKRAHWHTFQLLTKNAPRLLKFDFPPNVWVGASVPPSVMLGRELNREQQERMLSRTLDVLEQVNAPVRWMSIEPLSWDMASAFKSHKLQWVVIGAASNGRTVYQPEPAWVVRMLNIMAASDTPVFFKGNLRGNAGVIRWREEFPVVDANVRSWYTHSITKVPALIASAGA